MLPPTCQLRFRGLMEPGVRDMLSVANWGGNASFLPDPKAPLEKMVAEDPGPLRSPGNRIWVALTCFYVGSLNGDPAFSLQA